MQIKNKNYLLNCFLLLIPIFLWNILLYDYLPSSYDTDVFWKDIPKFVSYSENVLRIIVFVIPIFMIFSLKNRHQKIGLSIYLIGLVIYFSSWVILIAFPQSNWSQSLSGYMAPAFTTIIWFVGIGLIGNKAFFKFPYLSLVYIFIAFLFVAVHTLHAYIAFQNL